MVEEKYVDETVADLEDQVSGLEEGDELSEDEVESLKSKVVETDVAVSDLEDEDE